MIFNLSRYFASARDFFEKNFSIRTLSENEEAVLRKRFRMLDVGFPDREFLHASGALDVLGSDGELLSSGDVLIIGDETVLVDLYIKKFTQGKKTIGEFIYSIANKETFGGGTFTI